MTREELLNKIIELADPLDEIKEETVIADSEDLDSLALFNVFIFMKEKNANASFKKFKDCISIKNVIDYMKTLGL